MKCLNKVALIGAVGQEPEVRYSAQGMAIASFSLATSEKRKDKDEVTQWHNCVAFGKLAEIIQQYVTKGARLHLDGAIQYQQYEKDGEKRYATKIVVNDLILLSPPPGSDNQSSNQGRQKASGNGTSRPKAAPVEPMEDDSIPF